MPDRILIVGSARARRARRAARGAGAAAAVRGRRRAPASTSRRGGASDELDDTVDYGAVCEAVAGSWSSERYHAARAPRDAHRRGVPGRRRVPGVVVEVRKLHPPVRAQLDHVGVRIER